jgi:hypothetical protein
MTLLETRRAPAVRCGGWTLVPETRRLRLTLPLGRRARAGLSWSWPAAVRVQAANGEPRRLPVADWTRRVQIALLAAGGIAGLLLARRARARRCRRPNGKEPR